MQQIIDNLKTLRNGLFKDEQAVIELIDETLKLVEQKASQFDAFVMPKIAEVYICKIKLLGFPFAVFNKQKAEEWVNDDPEMNYYDTIKIKE